jgi:L-glyceraldehyde 3-phosphate reductase
VAEPAGDLTVIGASSVKQLEDNIAAARSLDFNDDELTEIDRYAVESGVDFWAEAREALAPMPRRDLAD